jgi:16S rRNA (cytosine967-C5)-methyltransferase
MRNQNAYSLPMSHSPESNSQRDYNTPRDARDAAYRVLSAHALNYPELHPIEPEVQHLDPRDRALAHAIIREGVVRWITLRHIVSELAGRGFETIENRMQAVLIGGAAQLLLHDRLPPHAVINESVEWAKRYIRPKAGGMTNAILRKVARARGESIEQYNLESNAIPLSDGGALLLNDVHLPDEPIALRSVAYSLPKATIKRWDKLYPDQSNQLIAHTLVKPPTLLYTDDWNSIEDSEDLDPHDSNTHRVYSGSRTRLYQLLEDSPELRVQDPASSSVVQSIQEGTYNTIIDFCAGQGTKTRQLSERFPESTIYAMEVDSKRLDTLDDVFQSTPNVSVHHTDELSHVAPNGVDLILTDVPCSNSGVLARRMEARYRPMTPQVQRISKIQHEILTQTIPYLKSTGTLVYSTCSVEHEENQDQRDWMIQNLNLELVSEHQVLPNGQPGESPSSYRDATYACFMRK